MSRVGRALWALVVLAALAAVGVAGALAFGVGPAALPAALDPLFAAVDALSEAPAPVPVIVGAVVVCIVGPLFVVSRLRAGGPSPWPDADQEPEAAHDTASAVLGEEFEATLGEDVSPPWDDPAVEGRVRDLAVEAVAQRATRGREHAEEAVETGAWTDDPRAAAYLGDEEVRAPLYLRVWDWLVSEPRRRRYVRHTVSAVESVWEGDR